MNSEKIFCQNCGKELEPNQRPCPFCGCNSIKIVALLSETVRVRENLALRLKRKGFKRFMTEIIGGWFPSKDKGKFPEGVNIQRVIDKEEDHYNHVVKDVATGEIVHEEHEPLSQHKHRRP